MAMHRNTGSQQGRKYRTSAYYAATKRTIATPQRRLVKRKRTRYLRVFAVLFFFLCMSSIIVLNVDAFKVKVVEITGVKRANAEQMYEDSQISIGENLFTLPVGTIKHSIESQPLVKSVSVHRVVPSKVRIKVYERQPFAYITNGRQYYLVDSDMIILEKLSGVSDPRLLRIHSDAVKHADIGQKLVFPYQDILMRMYRTDGANLKKRYGIIRFDHRGIKVILRDGTYVLLGDGSDIEKKLMLVPIVYRKLKEAGEKFEGLNFELLSVPSFIPAKG